MTGTAPYRDAVPLAGLGAGQLFQARHYSRDNIRQRLKSSFLPGKAVRGGPPNTLFMTHEQLLAQLAGAPKAPPPFFFKTQHVAHRKSPSVIGSSVAGNEPNGGDLWLSDKSLVEIRQIETRPA